MNKQNQWGMKNSEERSTANCQLANCQLDLLLFHRPFMADVKNSHGDSKQDKRH